MTPAAFVLDQLEVFFIGFVNTRELCVLEESMIRPQRSNATFLC